MAYPSDPVELRGIYQEGQLEVEQMDGGLRPSDDKETEISRLLGFALFNLHKGNLSAVETLVRKAYKANSGVEWDA